MYKPANYKPTESELEILKILWKKGSASVREIHDEINKTKNSGYTTTLKLMQIMFEKGILSREKEKKSHIYYPLVKENETQNLLLKKMMNSLFEGSASQMILQALGNSKTSSEEINQIRTMLDQIEREKNAG